MTRDAREVRLGKRLAQAIDSFEPFEGLRLLQIHWPTAIRSALTNRFVATALRPAVKTRAVETAFVGLAGPLSPLPPFYTEVALREQRRRNHGMRAFLDLFLARLVDLFVRAFEKYRLPSGVARHGVEGMTPLISALYATIGLGLPSRRGRLLTPDFQLLPYAGLLAREVRSAAGLEILLAQEMGLPIRVEPLQPRWLLIETDEQTRLTRGGHFSRLGLDAVAGARTLDVSSTFRVVVGPVDYAIFERLGRGSDMMARLVELVCFYADPGLDFDVQVILKKEAIPEAQLGAIAPQLGWNAWLRQLPALADADQPVFDPSAG
ncbi:MAG: type VI secretion system baseplate subunit TssG [Pseudomonadota bacterium]